MQKTEYYEILDEVCNAQVFHLLPKNHPQKAVCMPPQQKASAYDTCSHHPGRSGQADRGCALQFVAAVTQRWPKVRCLSSVCLFGCSSASTWFP